MSQRPGRRGGSGAVLLTASGASFLAMLDSTVTSLALPALLRDFPGASLPGLSWVISAYAVAFAALLAPAGRLADALGRRRVFVAGVVVFTVASLLCAVAPNLELLVACRVLQGIGAGAMMPTSLAILLHDCPPERRMLSIGLWSAAGALAAAVGPGFGGLLVHLLGWPAVFLVNLPFGVLFVVAALRLLEPSERSAARGLPDPLGALLLAVGIGAATLGVTTAETWGWTDPRTLFSLATGVLAVVAALRRSARHPVPAVDTGLFADRTFAAANVVALLYGVAQFAWLLACVLFLTDRWGYTELEAGLAQTPGAVMAAVGAVVMGKVAARFGGPRFAILFGLAANSVSGVWLLVALSDEPAFLTLWLPVSIIGGAGMGAAIMGTSTAAAMSVPPSRFASGSAIVTTARTFGQALGVAALAVILHAGAGPDGVADTPTYVTVFVFSTVLMAVSVVVTVARIRTGPPRQPGSGRPAGAGERTDEVHPANT
ncbi:MAG TPA: DHA2 family efflux MFS transporter permease subunit [Actinophytocola sp.]|nr:DHA2 family efflux MFS transporter permease subunit [Actinophytocola sp.]